MTASALYEGTIRHRRVRVQASEFRHGIALAYVDLDELPRLLGGKLVQHGPGVVRFRRSDYLGDDGVPLADAVRALVAERTGHGAGRADPAADAAAHARALLQPGSASTTATTRPSACARSSRR